MPATSSLLSRLPPYSLGSTVEHTPYSGGGATLISPKNGAKGMLGPHGSFAVIARRSIGITRQLYLG